MDMDPNIKVMEERTYAGFSLDQGGQLFLTRGGGKMGLFRSDKVPESLTIRILNFKKFERTTSKFHRYKNMNSD
jgi:hypothetical protein